MGALDSGTIALQSESRTLVFMRISMNRHPKHREIGDIISRAFGNNAIFDYACVGGSFRKQQIPLFTDRKKTAETRMCNVDIALINGNDVKVIIEIEESGIIPTKICGKFLTSSFSKYLFHYSFGEDPKIVKNCLFIQILNDEELPTNTKKKLQGNIIQEKIKGLSGRGSINDYLLLWYSDIVKNKEILLKEISIYL